MSESENRQLLRNFLYRYVMAKRRKKQLERRHDQIEEEIKCPLKSTRYSSMPRSPGVNNEGAAAILFMLDDIEQRIQEEQAGMLNIVIEIMEILSFLDKTSMERTVLELRYIDGASWNTIMKELAFSRSAVTKYEQNGIDQLLCFAKVQDVLKRFNNEEMEL